MNYITVKLNGGSEYEESYYLTEEEALLLDCKGNGAFQNAVWKFVASRINWREEMCIDGGAYQLVSYTINGETKPLH